VAPIVEGGPAPLPAYYPEFLERHAADELFLRLCREVAWATESVFLFGRRRMVPRLVAWCGDSGLNYRYAGSDHVCAGWHPLLVALRDQLRRCCGLQANLVLMNLYRSGQDAMGWHRDDEPGLDPLVASLSLGAARRFLMRPVAGEPSVPRDLAHGSLLLMDGRHPHALPRTRRIVGERINLSFRRMVPQ